MRYFHLLLLTAVCLSNLHINAETNLPESFVSYEKFGAKGDGITDDQKAIVSAHAYANKHNLPVKGKAGARYYIGSGSAVAVIKTDTDFNNAEFIIDDRNAQDYQQPIFRLEPDRPNTPLTALKSLKKNQIALNMTFPGKVMLLLEDKKNTRFNRYRKNRPVQKSPQRDKRYGKFLETGSG